MPINNPPEYTQALMAFCQDLTDAGLPEPSQKQIILSASHMAQAIIIAPNIETSFNAYLKAAKLKHQTHKKPNLTLVDKE